ncbi:uncharacterized protein LOC124915278 [Impatiens glandulifera]|uniref:uncharacterized protein LOC124915278 n=1 Tax=Impatiens glandulifera TaxID=253017 RepID=UPI001FB15436|nr:uncharacterized protein LOC124915278 [Impatiens glandulifera]
MIFGALRSIVRPVSRSILMSRTALTFPSVPSPPVAGSLIRQNPLWIMGSSPLHSLTDTRFPKRRPQYNPLRKRASLRPSGPYAWVKYVPGQPILPNQPNEGSFKNRNAKKRRLQRRAFILSEAKKRNALVRDANKKKKIKQVERKMAAVARERAWTERLAELQLLEKEPKNAIV